MPQDSEFPAALRPPSPQLYPPPPIAGPAPLSALTVGIVLRTRDRPLLLDRALRSIASQTHAAWRLHLVNDGGDRGALAAVLDRHAAALGDRLDLLHLRPPHGMPGAAQAGLERVTGDLVAVHDDDDSWDAGFLAAACGFLGDPAHARFAGVTTGCTLIEEEIVAGTVQERWRCPWPHARGTLDLRQALVEAQVPPISLVFRRAALAHTGGVNTAIRYGSDYEFLLRLLLAGDIGHVDRPLANYHHRVRGTEADYGNSVVERIPAREVQAVLLRNATLRAALLAHPDRIGPLQAVLSAIAERDPAPQILAAIAERDPVPPILAAIAERDPAPPILAALDTAAARISAAQASAAAEIAMLRAELGTLSARLDRLDAELAPVREAARQQLQTLRPLRAAWHRALPLRRAVARLRGRGTPPLTPSWLTEAPLLGPWLIRRELVRRFTEFHGRPPELDPPRGFNEHVIHRMLHDRDPRLPVICDKLAARSLIRDALGEAVLVPLLGAWDDPAEVPWATLPLPFAMKPNHASGLHHFVTAAEAVVPSTLTALARSWLAIDHYATAFEWGYRGIRRRLMVEPVLRGPDGGTPAEAQVFTFGGRAAFVRIYTGGTVASARADNWFDTEGRRQDIELTVPIGDYVLDPALARALADMAEALARGFAHLRVDFFLTEAGVKVGELTAYNRAGMAHWRTREMDLWLGRLWDEGAARLRAG